MGNLGAEKAKNQGLGWQQGCGGDALVKAPEEKWGKMGKAPEEKWGKMGKNWEKWGKMGENGEEMGRKCGERGPVAPPKFPYFPPFSPIFPHFPPIFPHFPPFFLAMGTLWVRLWVQYPPPEPGTSLYNFMDAIHVLRVCVACCPRCMEYAHSAMNAKGSFGIPSNDGHPLPSLIRTMLLEPFLQTHTLICICSSAWLRGSR